MMVVQPDAGVFAQLMSRWHSGNYTFVDSGDWGSRSGDDDQVSSALQRPRVAHELPAL